MDLVIENGTVFDGAGRPGEKLNVGIRDGKVAALSAAPLAGGRRIAPLGANITAFLGHSDLRARVMGLGRAVDAKARPTEPELQEMERFLEDALDCGLLGLSSMTNPWDKLDGDRHRSAQLPSTYATWK